MMSRFTVRATVARETLEGEHLRMNVTRLLLVVAVLVAGVVAWLSWAPGPSGRVVNGETGELYGGPISTWARVDADGVLQEVGLTIALAAVENAPVAAHDGNAVDEHAHSEPSVQVEFPSAVKSATYFDHVSVDFVPSGHPPAPYMLPHFDIHFYGISTPDQLAIDCRDATMPEASLVPADYVVVTADGTPTGSPDCVPVMGQHAADLTSPELDPVAPERFTKTMILGYYGGKFIFFEPMITRDYLLGRQSFEMGVPSAFQPSERTLYPRTFRGVYDRATDSYQLIWSDFELRG